MSRESRASHKPRPRAATTSYTVRFRKKPCRPTQPHHGATTGSIPRVTRLLALAHKIDEMILAGEIRDWAEAARLIGVTRARMTQIANLLLLAPEIQEDLLVQVEDAKVVCRVERALRTIITKPDWTEQIRQFASWR